LVLLLLDLFDLCVQFEIRNSGFGYPLHYAFNFCSKITSLFYLTLEFGGGGGVDNGLGTRYLVSLPCVSPRIGL